jgi:hypothetical protein
MSDNNRGKYLARLAGEIMFSDQYLDLLEVIYSARDTITEFEANAKGFLIGHGIRIPDTIEVIIHDPGEVGRPARVDFHWKESEQAALPDIFVARQSLRELVRVAYDTLHSPEMMQLKETVRSSPEALSEFTADPRAYATAHEVIISDELELIVHTDDPNGPRIDLHFRPATTATSEPALRPVGHGCCYCDEDTCCNYWTGPPY